MPYEVDLAVRVEDALDELAQEGRKEVMETIASALVRPGEWPQPGGWHRAVVLGPRSWVCFTAFLGGIEVIDVGWAG
ncbi:hypothetical protein ACFTY8_07075 [Streptomyces mirabilis]|uniref:hypothetical protein n=1 Tax=Streptomyces mirabilis TaxID=68239 RepID=UPI003633E03A